MIGLKIEVGGDYFMIRMLGSLCNKIPDRLQRSAGFLFSVLRFASEHRPENKNPSFASLRGDFVEVGGNYFMIRNLGAFATKSPARLQRITFGDPVLGNPSANPFRLRRYGLFSFILPLLQAGLGQKTKNP